jgi:hypothetical protein
MLISNNRANLSQISKAGRQGKKQGMELLPSMLARADMAAVEWSDNNLRSTKTGSTDNKFGYMFF